MGSTLSKRVSTQLRSSEQFTTTCATVFATVQSLTHQTPPKIFAYQLPHAADLLHTNLLHSLSSPRLATWCPSPPSRTQVDAAYRSIRSASDKVAEAAALDCEEFKEFGVVLFSNAVVWNAEKKVVTRVGLGVAGIVGVGAVARAGSGLVGSVIGVYALGVATSVFLSLR